MRWREFEAGAPDLASTGLREFERRGLAIVGTLRKDGRPRISCVDPCVVDGDLYLGMMWHSRKAVDLIRDPRLVLHNPICSNTGSELEFSLHGAAVEVRDDRVRSRYADAVADRTTWQEQFHLFRVDIESAAIVQYADGEQYVKVWPRGIERRRPYG